MTKEFLSICIPTYNRAEYLKRALESCQYALDNYDVKVYIQDNASQDNTQVVADAFAGEKVLYERNERNMGAKYSFNKLLERAKGEYVLFMTDDDYFFPQGIAKVLDFLKTYTPDFLSTDMIIHYIRSKHLELSSAIDKSGVISKAEAIQVYLRSNVMTRCCYRKKSLSGWRRDIQEINVYPHLVALMDLIANDKKIAYLADSVVMHTWENEVFWDKDFNKQKGVKYEELQNDLQENRMAILNAAKDKLGKEYYDEFCRNFYKIGFVRKEQLPVNLQNELEEKKQKKMECIRNVMLNEDVLVFGTGADAQHYYPLIKDYFNISGFLDNDKNKWGKKFFGLPILSPGCLKKEKYTVFVASGRYENEMIAQLAEFGMAVNKTVFSLIQLLKDVR